MTHNGELLVQLNNIENCLMRVGRNLQFHETDAALDEVTELIKAAMVLRDAIFRTTYRSGEEG